ncbi:MAG TPA: hypothetical protein VKR06_04425 [Ktedonosporobacter sp.]|nr:hypothetical protein [Ktedonosporobacter sp.]
MAQITSTLSFAWYRLFSGVWPLDGSCLLTHAMVKTAHRMIELTHHGPVQRYHFQERPSAHPPEL